MNALSWVRLRGGLALALCVCVPVFAAAPLPPRPSLSGIYPHLAMFNDEGECGTGAVVPWADRLWVVTYSPHKPNGSTDKLYEIDTALNQTVRPESVGGTPANRMIHAESQQLLIGPYLIDTNRHVRVLTPKMMPGRLTGTARHLNDPANKVYYATMEEGFYEVDVRSLAVTRLYPDANGDAGGHAGALLPGYHGKGLFSGQGRLVYANNGELSKDAQTRPDIESGSLAEWDGTNWTVVRRNQFTDVSGPGSIAGNAQAATDPLWSIGWDHRSLLLMLRDGGRWQTFRLPKSSHSYDGAHGWNTEWPRIRDIGEKDLLMTMHGMFWRFPKTFSAANTAGIRPRSSYLKVVGDFTRWKDSIVLGCDDTAKNEFLNKRAAKGVIAGPGQSQSNLQFVEPAQLDRNGPPLGRGAVWLDESVKAGVPSDAFLFAGFAERGLHLAHGDAATVTFTLETGDGRGRWKSMRTVTVSAHGAQWIAFRPADRGEWIRLTADRNAAGVSAEFQFSAEDPRWARADVMFAGVATADATDYSGGVIRTRGDNLRTLAFAATSVRGGKAVGEGFYELGANLKLVRRNDPAALAWTKANTAVPAGMLRVDAASVVFTDDQGKRWRLPKGAAALAEDAALPLRVDREVCTERDLFQAMGTFYELPAENAGGFAKVRPITTHNRRITDYCSYRGLLILAGVAADAPAGNPHVIRSDDGAVALWAGAVDDLWRFGKPRGDGGPWRETAVKAGEPSDPYLMTGYDEKRLHLSHAERHPVVFRVEVDPAGTGAWRPYRSFTVKPGATAEHTFPEAFHAYWVRVVADRDCRATAQLEYR